MNESDYTDPNLYRFVETATIEKLRADIEYLRSEASYSTTRIDFLEQRLAEYRHEVTKHHDYDYRVTTIIITPLAKDNQPDGGTDEHFYVSNAAEAVALEKEIFARQSELKRKVLIAQQNSLKSVPF